MTCIKPVSKPELLKIGDKVTRTIGQFAGVEGWLFDITGSGYHVRFPSDVKFEQEGIAPWFYGVYASCDIVLCK
jgi:hypothetical protein